MSFREYVTNFRYRRQHAAAAERHANPQPPSNPSRRYIDRLVRRLLDERTSWNARRELEMIGAAAAPSLQEAFADRRFTRAEWDPHRTSGAPLDAALELLVAHAPDDVVRIALPLATSPSEEVRKIAALHLASAGRSSAMAAMQNLMQDDEGYVRSYTAMGIGRAVATGRSDPTFVKQAYDLLLPQCDQDWGSATNDVAETIIALDPIRAAVDLADERLLKVSNRNVHRILNACNAARVALPESILRSLLIEALPLAVGERSYPNDYVAAAALRALASQGADGVATVAESLVAHGNAEVKRAAAEALATLAGIADPLRFVLGRVSEQGYETLSLEQRVVFCAYLFDAEVCNGGLMQFFANSSGDHVADTLDALSTLGLAVAHTALDTAVRMAGPLSRESDRELRLTAFEGRWDELSPAFDPLERDYYATKVSLQQAWLLYAVRHRDQFGG